MDHNAYTPIVLDLTDCSNREALHRRIQSTFDFPAYYGKNWDAMWDCLTDVFMENGVCRVIHIKGFDTMSNDLQNDCQAMKKIFSHLQQDFPDTIIRYL